jgi:galactosamine-6-phosphate isomerase
MRVRNHQRRRALRIELAHEYEELSRRAARDILGELRRKPGLLLGVATGESPRRTYERLAEGRAKEPDLFRAVRVVALDEWIGLDPGHPASCEAYVRERILGPFAIGRSRHQGFRSRAEDLQAECRRMASWLERHGPIDLCILGLGRNGHLLMNEPAASFDPSVHVARLAPSTRRHPMLKALESVPRFGFTLGLAQVLQSRRILLLVSGGHKRVPLRRMLGGRVATSCPASFLRLHRDVTVYCDRAAAP